jgi:hypothetical protein
MSMRDFDTKRVEGLFPEVAVSAGVGELFAKVRQLPEYYEAIVSWRKHYAKSIKLSDELTIDILKLMVRKDLRRCTRWPRLCAQIARNTCR